MRVEKRRCHHEWQMICLSGRESKVVECVRMEMYCEKCGKVCTRRVYYFPILSTVKWRMQRWFGRNDQLPF